MYWGYYSPNMGGFKMRGTIDNQVEKKIANEMEAGIIH